MIPLKDWCIVEKFEHMHKDVKIYLPDTADEVKADDQLAVKVLAVGPGYFEHGKFVTPDVDVGDVIITEGMAVVKFIYADETYLAVRARDAAFRAAGREFESDDEEGFEFPVISTREEEDDAGA